MAPCRLGLVAAAVLLALVAEPAVAQVGGICDINPSAVGCEGGGTGGDSGGREVVPVVEDRSYYWAGWDALGACPSDLPRSIRYLRWTDDGTYVRPTELTEVPPGAILGDDRVYQLVCSDLPEGDLWSSLVEDIESLPPPTWESSPPEPGITGLETWLWHSGTTTAGPVTVAYTDGTTGRTFTLEGRAWVGSITWDTGDGSIVRADAVSHAVGTTIGGSEAEPAARHMYETSSADAGLAAGYPVALDLTWVGEWRWREGTGAWVAWRPMLSTADVSMSDLFEVVQIVAELQP